MQVKLDKREHYRLRPRYYFSAEYLKIRVGLTLTCGLNTIYGFPSEVREKTANSQRSRSHERKMIARCFRAPKY